MTYLDYPEVLLLLIVLLLVQLAEYCSSSKSSGYDVINDVNTNCPIDAQKANIFGEIKPGFEYTADLDVDHASRTVLTKGDHMNIKEKSCRKTSQYSMKRKFKGSKNHKKRLKKKKKYWKKRNRK